MRILWSYLLTISLEDSPELIDYVFVYWLLGLFEEKRKETQKTIKKLLKEAHRDNYNLELQFTSDNLVDIGVADIMQPISLNYSKYSSKKLDNLIDKQFNKLSQTIQSQILNALNTKDTVDIENTLKELLVKDNSTKSIVNNLMRIYRTENVQMRSRVKLDIQSELEEQGIYVKRKWLHTLSNSSNTISETYKPREDHISLNGQVEDGQGYFYTKNGASKGPGLFGLPEEDINCRCDVYFVI